MKKRFFIAVLVLLNVNCFILASNEFSTVHDWIRTEYGEPMLLSILSDITAGFPGAITTWDASENETKLSLFISEAYCRFVISDEAIKVNQMFDPEGKLHGLTENFSLRGIQYSAFERKAVPFSWVIRSVRTNALNYCAIVHRATNKNQHMKFVVYVNMNNGKADLRFRPPLSEDRRPISFYSFPMLLRKERHLQYQLLDSLKGEGEQQPIENNNLENDIKVDIIEKL